jgi:hypothetical protein
MSHSDAAQTTSNRGLKREFQTNCANADPVCQTRTLRRVLGFAKLSPCPHFAGLHAPIAAQAAM